MIFELAIGNCRVSTRKLAYPLFRDWDKKAFTYSNKVRFRGGNSCVRVVVFGFNNNNCPFEMLLNLIPNLIRSLTSSGHQ